MEWKDDVKDLIAFDDRIPVVLGYPVVLRGVPFQQAFSVVCMHFRPYYLNYIIIHAHYSGSIKVKKFAFGREMKFGVVFKAGLITTG